MLSLRKQERLPLISNRASFLKTRHIDFHTVYSNNRGSVTEGSRKACLNYLRLRARIHARRSKAPECITFENLSLWPRSSNYDRHNTRIVITLPLLPPSPFHQKKNQTKHHTGYIFIDLLANFEMSELQIFRLHKIPQTSPRNVPHPALLP